MQLKDIAKRIPRKYRDHILETNTLFNAQAVPNNEYMIALFTIWTTFVNSNPDYDISCTICLSDILRDFKRLEPFILELSREDKLLDL